MSTSVISQEKKKQCQYKIKDANGVGYFNCQSEEGHELKGLPHTLPQPSINCPIVTSGDWFLGDIK